MSYSWHGCILLAIVFLCRSDSIESNVETAAVRVESGNKQLERAVVYKVKINMLAMATTYLHFSLSFSSSLAEVLSEIDLHHS